MQVVLNRVRGPGFKLSHLALRWLYDNGVTVIATPVGQVFNNLTRTGPHGYIASLARWEAAKQTKPNYPGPVFTDDGLKVLDASGFNNRSHAKLIQCVQTLGAAASGEDAQLELVTIPDGTNFIIVDRNGLESAVDTAAIWP